MKFYPAELFVRSLKLTVSLLKTSLNAKCARRRGESAVLCKNEHAAQARTWWHVRSAHAGGFGRRIKNIRFSQDSMKMCTVRRQELSFLNVHRTEARAPFCRPLMVLMTT